MGDRSKYFNKRELICGCGCGKEQVEDKLLVILDNIRKLIERPLFITSGYRCKEYNSKVGGVPNSAHTKGLAVDIQVENSKDRWQLLNIITTYTPITRIGIGLEFIHIDIEDSKPTKVLWTY